MSACVGISSKPVASANATAINGCIFCCRSLFIHFQRTSAVRGGEPAAGETYPQMPCSASVALWFRCHIHVFDQALIIQNDDRLPYSVINYSRTDGKRHWFCTSNKLIPFIYGNTLIAVNNPIESVGQHGLLGRCHACSPWNQACEYFGIFFSII